MKEGKGREGEGSGETGENGGLKTTRGFIFDIQRFLIHGGSGIRTTVFFK